MAEVHPYCSVYKLVQRIPAGRVLTYGAISKLLGRRLSAQGVGWAMKALSSGPSEDRPYHSQNVPWHRVVNSQGTISTSSAPGVQQALLEAEGVEFDEHGLIDLKRFLFDPLEGEVD